MRKACQKVDGLNTEKRALSRALKNMELRFLTRDAEVVYRRKDEVTHYDLMGLIDGTIAVLYIHDLISDRVCDLVCKGVDIEKMRGYNVLPEFLKGHGSMPLYEGKADMEGWYKWANSSHNPSYGDSHDIEWPSSTMRRFFDNTFANGACLARVEGNGRAAPYGMIRGMKGGGKTGVFTHSDSMTLDHPNLPFFNYAKAALSMVIGLNAAGPGAETSIYPIEITNTDDYNSLTNDFGGIEERYLPPPQATVKVGKSDAIIFNSNMLHNVSPLLTPGDVRLTISGFAVYFEDGRKTPLALFS